MVDCLLGARRHYSLQENLLMNKVVNLPYFLLLCFHIGFILPRVWVVRLLFSPWFLLSFTWAGCHCMHWGSLSGCGGAYTPSESLPLDILLTLLLIYFHFLPACIPTYPVLTNTNTAHLFPAQEVGCNLKADGRAQSQKGLGVMGPQHGTEEPRAAALYKCVRRGWVVAGWTSSCQ